MNLNGQKVQSGAIARPLIVNAFLFVGECSRRFYYDARRPKKRGAKQPFSRHRCIWKCLKVREFFKINILSQIRKFPQ
jgi:hypothetical protein